MASQSYLGKIALAIADQQTCLAASSISDNHNLLGVRWSLGDICCGGFPTC